MIHIQILFLLMVQGDSASSPLAIISVISYMEQIEIRLKTLIGPCSCSNIQTFLLSQHKKSFWLYWRPLSAVFPWRTKASWICVQIAITKILKML